MPIGQQSQQNGGQFGMAPRQGAHGAMRTNTRVMPIEIKSAPLAPVEVCVDEEEDVVCRFFFIKVIRKKC